MMLFISETHAQSSTSEWSFVFNVLHIHVLRIWDAFFAYHPDGDCRDFGLQSNSIHKSLCNNKYVIMSSIFKK